MKSYKHEHELARRQLWMNMCVAVASANDCKSPETPTSWANHALKEFDKQFSPLTDDVPAMAVEEKTASQRHPPFSVNDRVRIKALCSLSSGRCGTITSVGGDGGTLRVRIDGLETDVPFLERELEPEKETP